MITFPRMSIIPADLVSRIMLPHIVNEISVAPEQQMSIQTIMTIRQRPLLKVRMVMQEMGKDMQKQFAAGKQPDPDVITKMKDVQKEFIASQQQVQTDADRAIFETMKRQQQLTEILTKSQLDILGTMKGDTTEAKRPDFYSQVLRRQVLRRQVLPIIQRAIARLKEFTKPLTTSRKNSATTKRSPTSSSERTQAS
jgi:hypothetical protein